VTHQGVGNGTVHSIPIAFPDNFPTKQRRSSQRHTAPNLAVPFSNGAELSSAIFKPSNHLGFRAFQTNQSISNHSEHSELLGTFLLISRQYQFHQFKAKKYPHDDFIWI
jgi:hypothetical protein